MAVLHVRNVPEVVYASAQRIAAERGTTLSTLVIELMQEVAARQLDRKRHQKVLSRMRKRMTGRAPSGATSADLIDAARASLERVG
jgi:hypothetical protein